MTDRILRPREVVRATGLSRATIDRKAGRDFPGKVILSRDRDGNVNAVGWRESEVRQWIESRERAA